MRSLKEVEKSQLISSEEEMVFAVIVSKMTL